MKCVIPEISWHNREPVLCVDVHPNSKGNQYKMATGGADYHILVWTGTVDNTGGVCVQVAADLTRHQKAVNALRWSPDGTMLASADDDAIIFLWTQKTDGQEIKNYRESYVVQKVLRGHKDDIYDICWSPKGDKILTGSIDNSAMLWDVVKGKCEYIFCDHKGFVQGVCWDPKDQYIATLSSDRVCRIIDITTKQVKSRILKGFLPVPESHPFHNKEVKYFHDDTFKSYFRRFGFSPDGNLFIAPAGYVETDDNKTMKCAYMFTLHNPQPVGIFPFDNRCTLVAKFSPSLFELSPVGPEPYINLPYRMVFAIAAETDIFLYDTQQLWPFGRLKNVHYTRITDLSWSSDGRLLVAASSDGYCTLLSFIPGEIGELYVKEEVEEEKENTISNISNIDDFEMESEEIKETSDVDTPLKKPTFLLQWAHKAREGVKVMSDIAEEKINVLTARRVPKSENDKTKTKDEVIQIEDSPVKHGSEIPSSKSKKVVGKISTAERPMSVRRKSQQDTTTPSKKEKHVKSNSLLKFLATSPEKKIKPALDDAEARDSWNCDGKANNQKPPEPVKVDLTDDITVPDLDLKLENSTQHKLVANTASSTSCTSGTSGASGTSTDIMSLSSFPQSEVVDAMQVDKKVPRRVPLITLSSPKHKKQKNP